ncbi:56b7e017-f735-4e00-afc0-c4261a7d1f56 [Thermothielavioides terrestris]|uniref:56b7e017-f735-4e00-afc0-c4261a7d1f56 n=1 Tax=Thermothielavioides terrestris TaxID=2587410 RepID=A0A3S4BAE6_9PEZI|nr:56b7e017-f735-4e00-afc0-c4261a7d1f56 [Thermothielavioides terrestris]
MDRHEYGITKNRKASSTGGGRAWSEDEEAYLLQTRLQKMPYKHIAAHLKKTELACRLHYHQLSHGSNRRKRTTSMSSGSSTSGLSPVLQTSIPSPIHEHDDAHSRSVSPPESAGSYGSTSPGGIQLPSIMSATASTDTSPRLPTILPKPASMTLALASMCGSGSTSTASPTTSRGYPTPLHETHPHNVAPVTSSGYRGSSNPAPLHSTRVPNSSPHHHGPGPLRLDCSALPPPPSAGLPAPPGFMASHPVDMARLNAIYNAHRASFWAAIAADYGPGANPLVLEQAWRSSSSTPAGSGSAPSSSNPGIAAQTPITPIASPDDQLCSAHVHPKPDKTRISAILGIDANPKSPSEREMVRRLEEERNISGMGIVGA